MARLKTKAKELTPKQMVFVAAFVQHGNALRAAVASGTPEDSAGSVGHVMLNNAEVAAEIERRMLKIAEKLEVTPKRIVAELSKIAFATLPEMMEGHTYDFSSMDKSTSAAVKAKLGALDSLAKILRMGIDKDDGKTSLSIDNRVINVTVLEPEQREQFRAVLEAARASTG